MITINKEQEWKFKKMEQYFKDIGQKVKKKEKGHIKTNSEIFQKDIGKMGKVK